MLAFDGLSCLLYLAGGIAVVIGLGGADCSNGHSLDLLHNDLLNEGTVDTDAGTGYGVEHEDDWAGALSSRCKQFQADAAFMFISFVLCAAIAGIAFWRSKRGTGTKGVVV